ncbi:MAG: DoxX family protein [Myxococcota bacterium]
MQKWLALAKTLGARLQSFEWVWVLVARLGVGGMFMLSGWGKLQDLDKFVKYFTRLGIPLPEFQAPFVAVVELVGGFLLILGLGTRLFGFLLGFTMIVALATSIDYEGKGLSDFLYLSEWLLLLLSFWFIFRGAGQASLDHRLFGGPTTEHQDEG